MKIEINKNSINNPKEILKNLSDNKWHLLGRNSFRESAVNIIDGYFHTVEEIPESFLFPADGAALDIMEFQSNTTDSSGIAPFLPYVLEETGFYSTAGDSSNEVQEAKPVYNQDIERESNPLDINEISQKFAFLNNQSLYGKGVK